MQTNIYIYKKKTPPGLELAQPSRHTHCVFWRVTFVVPCLAPPLFLPALHVARSITPPSSGAEPRASPSEPRTFQMTSPRCNLVNTLSSVHTAARISEVTGHRRPLQAEAAARTAVN